MNNSHNGGHYLDMFQLITGVHSDIFSPKVLDSVNTGM
jgi:hypothetical protein